MDLDLSRAAWRTSSYSGANGSCVEVAPVPAGAPDGAPPARIAVRDTKDRSGPVLVFTAHQWRSLAAGIKAGELLLS
jgi:uncharacterized protein DUF397